MNRASAVVDGWRFTYNGGVYVDIQPPGCRTAIDCIWVDDEEAGQVGYLQELGREWLKQHEPDLAGYIESARWYDSVDA